MKHEVKCTAGSAGTRPSGRNAYGDHVRPRIFGFVAEVAETGKRIAPRGPRLSPSGRRTVVGSIGTRSLGACPEEGHEALLEQCRESEEFASQVVSQAFREDDEELKKVLSKASRQSGFSNLANAWATVEVNTTAEDVRGLTYTVNHELSDVLFQEAKEADERRWDSLVHSFFGKCGPMTMEELVPALAEELEEEVDDVAYEILLAVDVLTETGKISLYKPLGEPSKSEALYLTDGIPDTRKVVRQKFPIKIARTEGTKENPYIVMEDTGERIQVSRSLTTNDRRARGEDIPFPRTKLTPHDADECEQCGVPSESLEPVMVPVEDDRDEIRMACDVCVAKAEAEAQQALDAIKTWSYD